MHDALGMRGSEPPSGVQVDVQDRAPRALFDGEPLPHRAAFDELHGDEDATAIGPDVEHADDVRV
jgi:hypothetical protein